MKKNIIIGLLLILSISYINLDAEPIVTDNNYDICELFMDSKPIVTYDLMFGDVIKTSAFFVKDRKQPCMNYSYTLNKNGQIETKIITHLFSGLEVTRKYKYNDDGLITEVTETREQFKKRIIFNYKNLKIIEIHEQVLSGQDDPLFNMFDYLKYKIDNNGNIVEVKGVKDKIMGLSSEIVRIKTYDYDEKNRLRAIRNFINPENTQIFSYNDYVNK